MDVLGNVLAPLPGQVRGESEVYLTEVMQF